MLWTTATVLATLIAIMSGYVYWQYRTAGPLPLSDLPVYAPVVPLTDIPEPQRDDAEARLRNFASAVQAGYQVADEQFLATRGPFIWDALRKDFRPYLESSGYEVVDGQYAVAQKVVYSLYRHSSGLRRSFNNDMVLAAALYPPGTSTGGEITLYGYFRLTQN